MAERKRRGGQTASGRPAGSTGGSRRDDDEVLVNELDETSDVEEVDDDLEDESEDSPEDDDSDDSSSEDSDKKSSAESGGAGVATKTRPKKQTKTKTPGRFGIFRRLLEFLREVVAELRKVIWPTRTELGSYTLVVVVFVTLILSIVGLLDYGFGRLVLYVFGGAESSDS